MALRLEDFSDRELLFALEEHADSNGMVTVLALAEGMGLSGLDHPTRNLSSRLSWLRRYGVVDRDEKRRWFLTTEGARILHMGLKRREATALEGMDEHALFAAMEMFGNRFMSARPESATMAQRQWRYAMAQRKARSRS